MPIYEYDCPEHGRFERIKQTYGPDPLSWCDECDFICDLIPSTFSRTLVAEEVVQARKDKAPEIEALTAYTDSNHSREVSKRQRAAERMSNQKDRARQTQWTSKTFIPGAGVRTTYPRGLEVE